MLGFLFALKDRSAQSGYMEKISHMLDNLLKESLEFLQTLLHDFDLMDEVLNNWLNLLFDARKT